MSQSASIRNVPIWARQPMIQPNYNMKKFKRFPQNMTNQLKNVLLHTNVTEKNKLEARTRQISSQRASSMRSENLHRQAFIVRQIMQEMQLEATGASCTTLLPKQLVKENRHLALFHNFFYMGGKDLPIHHRLDRFFLKSLQQAQVKREVVQSTYTVKRQKRPLTEESRETSGSVKEVDSFSQVLSEAARLGTKSNPTQNKILPEPRKCVETGRQRGEDGTGTTTKNQHLPFIIKPINRLADDYDTENRQSAAKTRAAKDKDISMRPRRRVSFLSENTASSDPRFSRLENLLESSNNKSWKQSQSLMTFQTTPRLNREAGLKTDSHQTRSLERILIPAVKKQYTRSNIIH